LCEAMQRIPGNHNFSKRYEFATTIGHYYGPKGELLGQIFVNICLQASNIASIIVAAQVMDGFLVYLFGKTFAVHFVPPYKWLTVTTLTERPFEAETYVLSLGYLLCMVVCIPFGYFNLDENMGFQWFSFVTMLGTIAEFCIQFWALNWNFALAPAWGHGFDGQALVLGVVAFSWAFVITIPSWVNEKQGYVSVNKSVWGSTFLALVIKLVFGYLAAVSLRNDKENANILNVMVLAPNIRGPWRTITSLSVYLFNIGTILPGIPVYSILVRYNILSSPTLKEYMGPISANIFGVVAPWTLSMFFYHGEGFSNFVNWSAIIFQGFVNFVVPCILYYQAVKMYPTIPFFHQKHLQDTAQDQTHHDEDACSEGQEEPLYDEITRPTYTNAVPSWIRVNPMIFALVIAVIMTLLSVGSIVLDVVLAFLPT